MRIAEPYRDLMQWQIVIELAGGIAEAIHRGERRSHAILAFAASHCSMDTDLTKAAAVLADLRRLTCHRYDAQPFAGTRAAEYLGFRHIDIDQLPSGDAAVLRYLRIAPSMAARFRVCWRCFRTTRLALLPEFTASR